MRSSLDFLLVAVGVLSAANNSLQLSTPDSPTYTAAVVEYNPVTTGTAAQVFEKNVDNYEKLIEEAAKTPHEADIIVFPECGLESLGKQVFSRVPEPTSLTSPCKDTSAAFVNLHRLSCAAEQHRIYVVINLYEIFPCDENTTSNYNETCPKEGMFYYNTDIVFDREGRVVARYRKFHLFGEWGVSTPPSAEDVTFLTDFGVTFGLFTCFDILFESPAVRLVREKNITDIIFPTAWFSELPFLTALQVQAGWAHGMDVNFLGAGYNNPEGGSGGSGIFLGRRGPLASIMPSSPLTQLLVGVVTKTSAAAPTRAGHKLPTSTGMYMKQENLTPYATHLLDLEVSGTYTREVCHGEFCCSFDVIVRSRTASTQGVSYSYRLAVFNGVRSFDGVDNGFLQVCALVACTNTTLPSCGSVFSEDTTVIPTVFQLIRVNGTFKRGGTQIPSTLTEGYLPLSSEDFMLTLLDDADDRLTGEMILLREASPLTFGIYGRDFTRDHEPVTGGAASASVSGVVVTIFLLVLRTLL